MNIREAILAEHSKVQATLIADWIGNKPDRFRKLVDLFLNDEYRVVQRAAWIVSMVADRQPQLLPPYLEQMVHKMLLPAQHPAVRRNVLRLLQHIPNIPDELHGLLMNACFDYVSNMDEAIAVRAFSLTILGRLALQYPDIVPELNTIMDDMMEHGAAPALVSRVKQVRKILKVR